MSDFAILRGLLFAAELFVGSSVIVVLARLAVAGRSASLRHLVWSAAFGALLLLPLLAGLLPGAFVIALPAPQAVPVETLMSVGAIAPAPAPSFVWDTETIATALAGVWLVGVLLIMLHGTASSVALWFLRRASTAHPFESEELAALPALHRCELRVAKAAHGPITWGMLRPVILLPRAALFWPGERLEAVLRHELAHVRRHDSLTQMLSLIACALYWPNPLVWLARGIQRRDAEMAADDAVLAGGMTPSDYAGELLQVAAEVGRNRLPVAMALFMAAPPALSARVQAILEPSRVRKGVTAMDILKMTAVALLATSALVVARPSLAQDVPPAPPVAATPDVPDVPPVPPAPADAPEAPVPPVPPVPAIHMHSGHSYKIVRSTRDSHGNRHVSMVVVDDPADVAKMTTEIQPQIERAMVQVRMSRAELRRLQALQPHIDAEVHRAMAQARAAMVKVDDAKIRAQVEAALARAEKKLAAAQAELDRNAAVRDEDTDVDTDSDTKPDGDTK
jgi:beta-lactamase regulating signal transducer with metallopeptidase domain